MENTPARELALPAMDALLAHTADLIVLKDARLAYLRASDSFCRLTGCAEEAELLGKTVFDFFDKSFAAFCAREDRRLAESGEDVAHSVVQMPDGGPAEARCRYALTRYVLRDAAGDFAGLLGVARATPRQDELEALRRRASLDALTGLYNRESTIEQIEACLAACGTNRRHALLFIDLDCFKAVNDRKGHAVGDTVLRETAQRIRSVFRRDDIVGRVGGDEFLVLLKDIGGEAEARARAAQVVASVTGCGQQDMLISCCVGIALYRGNGESFRQLYIEADEAMYAAKKLGPGFVSVYRAPDT